MTFTHLSDEDFVAGLTDLILVNLENEHYTVEDVALKSGMHRKALNRRLLKIKQLHVNEFIREIRLRKSLELLEQGNFTIAEIAYRVGFGSPTYFSKCFHQQYGYPPVQFKTIAAVAPVPADDNPVRGKEELPLMTKRFKPVNIILITFVLLGTVTFIIYRYFFPSDKANAIVSENGKISVAIMPFQNMTNDTAWNVWQDGIQTILITSLTNSEGLRVRQLENTYRLLQSKGITNYASITPSVASTLAQELNANVLICGNIIKAPASVRLNSLLINSKTKEVFKSFRVEGTPDRIMSLIDTLSKGISDFLIISNLKWKDSKLKWEKFSSQNYAFYTPTRSAEAFRYLIYGKKAYRKWDLTASINNYLHAVELDSNLYAAYEGLFNSCFAGGNYEQANKWLFKYYSKLDRLDVHEKALANYLYAMHFKTPKEAIRYAEQIIDLDDQDPMAYYRLGDTYFGLLQYDKAIPWFEKALEGCHKLDIKPPAVWYYSEPGIAYHKTGAYKKEKKLYKKAQEDFPDDLGLMDQFVVLALTEGDTVTANMWIKKYIAARREKSYTDADEARSMAYFALEGGSPGKAEKYYRQSLALDPGKPVRMSTLAWFLIDKDRNYREGLALIDSALKISPGNYNFLHVKGWGLYKQGKHKEALEALQKSWYLRMKNAGYDHTAYLHLESAKKAVAGIK